MAEVHINDKFITALRKKLRFTTSRGQLSVEDLWDLDLKTLDTMAVNLNTAAKAAEGAKTFLTVSGKKRDPELNELKFEIVLHILQTKQAEKELAANKRAIAEEAQQLSELIKKKELEHFQGQDVEVLKKRLAELKKDEDAIPA